MRLGQEGAPGSHFARSEQSTHLLLSQLGADECLDYRSPSFEDDLVKATEGYVDVYFDNVGGSILNALFKRMKRFSRIIACGAISGYNSRETVNMNNIFEVISMRITMQGASRSLFQLSARPWIAC